MLCARRHFRFHWLSSCVVVLSTPRTASCRETLHTRCKYRQKDWADHSSMVYCSELVNKQDRRQQRKVLLPTSLTWCHEESSKSLCDQHLTALPSKASPSAYNPLSLAATTSWSSSPGEQAFALLACSDHFDLSSYLLD